MSRPRVLAAMSGGVDSGVAAALLAEQGHPVTGVTLKLWCYGKSPVSERACCTLDAIEDARAVARAMGFPHFVVDAEEVFRARVLQPFLDDYAAGRTPYPCALCNQHLKFGDLVARMELAGADVLATGHYARVARLPDGSAALFRAADAAKDQSYALALIPYAALERVVLPLGELQKHEVRAHAERLGLEVWDKPESQDLCFVPDGDYAGFMERKLGETRLLLGQPGLPVCDFGLARGELGARPSVAGLRLLERLRLRLDSRTLEGELLRGARLPPLLQRREPRRELGLAHRELGGSAHELLVELGMAPLGNPNHYNHTCAIIRYALQGLSGNLGLSVRAVRRRVSNRRSAARQPRRQHLRRLLPSRI